MEPTDEQLLDRAYAAYFQACAREGVRGDQPASDTSAVEELDGKHYVVLRNARGILRVYRVRNDGMLKGLRRWPKELEDG